MKASDYIAEFVAGQGVRHVYEMCGGMITHLLDSFGARDDIQVVSMHHEQAAGFAAEAGARMTGVPGVAMATSGPGATNLITAIGSCYFDSVPVVFITGQVNTGELRGDSGVRQAGFQETDIVALTTPITKASMLVTSADDLPGALASAFEIALSDRPGPVLLDIPMNVQRQDVVDVAGKVSGEPAREPLSIGPVIDALAAARRPMLLVGGGVRTAGAVDLLREFADRADLPVALTLMGADALSFDDPMRVGLIGSYGNRWANLAMGESDCILVLGARLDVRQTGADLEAFREGKTIVRVDIDQHQLDWRLPADVPVRADLSRFLSALMARADEVRADRAVWHERIDQLRRAWPDGDELLDVEGINPASLMHAVSDAASGVSAFITDVGQNQMWSAQSLRLGEGQRLLTSGGMGAMGFALPSAIGAALSGSGASVVMIAGDGGMQVNIQELETVARLGLPIKMIVLNNRALGMVRQFQDELFESRYQSTLWGYGAPDFRSVAEAYGVPARQVSSSGEITGALDWLFADPKAPGLLEVLLPQITMVRPKVTFGNPVFVMEPPPGRDASHG